VTLDVTVTRHASLRRVIGAHGSDREPGKTGRAVEVDLCRVSLSSRSTAPGVRVIEDPASRSETHGASGTHE